MGNENNGKPGTIRDLGVEELTARVEERRKNILLLLLQSGEIEKLIRSQLEEVVGAHVAMALGLETNPWARDKWDMWKRQEGVVNRYKGSSDYLSRVVKESVERLKVEVACTGLSDDNRQVLLKTANMHYRNELMKELNKIAEQEGQKAAMEIIGSIR